MARNTITFHGTADSLTVFLFTVMTVGRNSIAGPGKTLTVNPTLEHPFLLSSLETDARPDRIVLISTDYMVIQVIAVEKIM